MARAYQKISGACIIILCFITLYLFWRSPDAASDFELVIRTRFNIKDKYVDTLRTAIDRLSEEEEQRALKLFLWLCPSDENCIVQPPFYQMLSQYRVAKRFSLVACAIYKNMSTLLTALMCYLHDPSAIASAPDFRSQWGPNRSCIHQNEFFKKGQLERFTGRKMQRLSMFALVRDPMEKFLSGLENQCVENQRCGQCITTSCLLGMLEINARQMLRMDDYTLGARAEYSVAEHVNLHFQPQIWRCDFQDTLPQYRLVQYSSSDINSIVGNLTEIFEFAGASQDELKFISDAMEGGRSVHSTFGNEHRNLLLKEIQSSPELMRKFLGLFFFDYVFLGFSLPRSDVLPY